MKKSLLLIRLERLNDLINEAYNEGVKHNIYEILECVIEIIQSLRIELAKENVNN